MIEGNLVDVRTGKVFPARISQRDGVITAVDEVPGPFDGFLIPGLIDAHVHIESSLLCPSRFAEAVVPHGTTAVVANPHEIANVLGLPGVEYMRRDSQGVPLRVYFTAPSCVPTTPFETSGASFSPADIESMLSRDDFVALGEVMDYQRAIRRDPVISAEVGVAKRLNKPVDGHAPMLTGEALKAYAGLGITTDHECTTQEEALERAALGMTVMVRQGSASKDLGPLAGFARDHEFVLVSDDMDVAELVRGHLSRSLAEAVSLGIDPVHALRAVTINPATHYQLPLGVIEPGRMADMVKVRDLELFVPEDVYVGGEIVASKGVPRFQTRPKEMTNQLLIQRKVPSDFEVRSPLHEVEARVIGLVKDEVVTEHVISRLRVVDGRVMPDLEKDVLRVSVVNRYREAPVSRGFVKGFGLMDGAIASSVAHDSHNIIVVGVGSDDMATAVNTVVQEGGGFCVCSHGRCHALSLRIAGLMCTKPAHEVARVQEALLAEAHALGCSLRDPFITMSFLSLLVIPKLKLGDRGLFDVEAFKLVDTLVSRP